MRLHDHREDLAQLSRGAARADFFSWDRQGQRMMELYRDVLKQTNGMPATADIDIAGWVGKPRADRFVAETISGLAAAGDPTIARRN